METKYLILFDIDGTILNFKQYNSKEIFSKMLKNIFGKDVPMSMMPRFAGLTDLEILEGIATNIGLSHSELYEKINKVWDKILADFKEFCTPEYIDLLPGVKELIKVLDKDDKYQLGLQTGNFKDNAYAKLDSYDLGKYFPFGAFGSDSSKREHLPPLAIKRANEYYNQTLFNNTNTLVIGDSNRDIECAKANNLPALAVATGYESIGDLKAHNPDKILQNFSDLESALNIIENILIK